VNHLEYQDSKIVIGSRRLHACYKPIDTRPRFLAVDLQKQLLPGSLAYAVNHLLDHDFGLSGLLVAIATMLRAPLRLRPEPFTVSLTFAPRLIAHHGKPGHTHAN